MGLSFDLVYHRHDALADLNETLIRAVPIVETMAALVIME